MKKYLEISQDFKQNICSCSFHISGLCWVRKEHKVSWREKKSRKVQFIISYQSCCLSPHHAIIPTSMSISAHSRRMMFDVNKRHSLLLLLDVWHHALLREMWDEERQIQISAGQKLWTSKNIRSTIFSDDFSSFSQDFTVLWFVEVSSSLYYPTMLVLQHWFDFPLRIFWIIDDKSSQ